MTAPLSQILGAGRRMLAASGVIIGLAAASAQAADGTSAPLKAKLPEAYRDGLVAVYDPQYPPSYFIDDSGKIVGYVLDFQEILAAKLGAKAKSEQAKFAAIIPGILGGRYHMSFFHDTVERRAKMDFVDFHQTGTVVMVLAGNPNGLDLNDLCGRKIGVASGAQQQLEVLPRLQGECATRGKPPIEASAFSGLNEGSLAVKSRRIEAWLGDAPSVGYIIKQTKGAFAKTPTADLRGLAGFAFKKGDPMAVLVKEALGELMKDGTYKKVLDEWHMSEMALKAPLLNGE